MGARFSGGGATVFHDRTDTPGEIVTELVNSTDGQGLHFDGAAGYIDIASPPDLGTKFSFELIAQADDWGSADRLLIDFKSGSSRFQLASTSSTSYNLGIFTTGGWANFGVKVLDDLKVHHLVVTVDGTSAIAYDNGNQVGILTAASSDQIDAATDANIGRDIGSGASLFNGTLYRTRFWNKTLSQAEVTASFENATVPFSDQYGNATVLNSGSVPAGLRWRIIEQNTVNFTTYGAADNDIGTEFVTTASIPALNANDRLQQIGCFVDYDLAFANPTQSRMVQDRAGAADGTSSATGVEQVTPIEQLNSKSARIGTTAATPADGDLVVSGNVGIGALPVTPAGLSRYLTVTGTTPGIVLDDTDVEPWEMYASQGNLKFLYNNTGPAALVISSAGNVGIGCTPSATLQVKAANGDGLTLQVNSESVGSYSQLRFLPAFSSTATPNMSIRGYRGASFATNYMMFETNSGEAMRLDSAGLATFANGINLGNENLEDYDEGTWSPTVSPHVSGSVTLKTGEDTGSYVRVGNLCICGGQLGIDSVSSPNGQLYISLPFTMADTTDYSERWGNSCAAGGLNGAAAGQVIYPNTGTTAIATFFEDGTGTGAWLGNKLQADSFIFFTVAFKVA
jgi:hypothetical protein